MGSVVDLAVVRSNRIIRRALMQTQDALRGNLAAEHNPSDADTIVRIRLIVLKQEVESALHSSDEPLCIAYLDTVRALIFRPMKPRTLMAVLGSVLDQPILNRVLGRRQNRSYQPLGSHFEADTWPPETA
jgi:hypothetical protein